MRTQPTAKHAAHDHDDDHDGHGHSHGLVDRSIVRSREGVKAVSISLAVLGIAAGIQLAIFTLSGSVALLADLIHNFGDADRGSARDRVLPAQRPRREVRRSRGRAGDFRLGLCRALRDDPALHPPQHLTHLWVLALAGVVGFVGNEVAAQVRLHAGKRLASAAMTADGNHARIDGFVSLGVVASAIVVALGAQIADPIIGLTITLVILKITWDSWNTVRKATIDLEHVGDEDDDHEHADGA